MFDTGATEAVSDLLDALEKAVGSVIGLARVDVAEEEPTALALGAGEVDVVAACERVVRVAHGLQLDAVLALDERRRATEGRLQDEETMVRSLSSEIALARQVSSPAGRSTYALAHLATRFPRIHALLRDGTVSKAVVEAVCRETSVLSADDCDWVEERLIGDLPGWGPRRAADATRALVLSVDPHAAYERSVRAREDRGVGVTRHPDATSTLHLHAPAEQVAAVYARLDHEASARRADGDARTITQLMADVAVEVLTGAPVGAEGWCSVPATVDVVMRPETLFGDEDSAGVLLGYGPVPAELARRLATDERAWLRRFFTDRDGTRLVDSESRRRRFPAGVARAIRATDGHCTRPWCDCGGRDLDHQTPYAAGGLSTAANGGPVCRTDNLTKEAHGWRVDRVHTDVGEVVRWRTPTGHSYSAPRPRAPGAYPGTIRPRGSVPEHQLRGLVNRARADERADTAADARGRQRPRAPPTC
ncbi:hypothetical protein CLV56_2912 [Mumia flava]|uniref:DUF222 domain-containing protein n=1 Tax=Mumia flava TaxID=1348852 RepID=A0A0B2B908_9ACTN|nr:HNH endonuclease signature motif containing protein [Mumia flava]PJJ53423.1 hypothetical protein CLV56_2912 [Mumia flava]